MSGAGEREVKKLNLRTLPVFWCLGDEPTMHAPGVVPETPIRRVIALPMTDPLVSAKNPGTRRRGLNYLPRRAAERVGCH